MGDLPKESVLFFSVVVPAYNQAELLRATLTSLASQTFSDYEVIVVDDGSSDDEVCTVAEAASRANPRVRVLRQPVNRGLPEARNEGLSAARGRYVIFLDHDDLYQEWTLDLLHEVICTASEPGFVVGLPERIDGGSKSLAGAREPVRYRIFSDYLDYRTQEENWWFVPSGAAIRADVLRVVHGFWRGRDFCEDIDLWLRLGDVPRFVRIESPRIFGYRIHDANNHRHSAKMGAGILRMIRQETTGAYPGGNRRKRQRLTALTAHARHIALELQRKGEAALAFRLYRGTFLWNLLLGRWLFLFGFPCIALGKLAAARWRRPPGV